MITRRKVLAELAACAASPGLLRPCVALASESNEAAVEMAEAALRTEDFVESVGVCGHLTWRQSIWGTSSWQPLFLELGVRSIRTALGSGGIGRSAAADLEILFEEGGVRADVHVGPNDDGIYDFDEAQKSLDFLESVVGAEKLLGIEGPNEPNNPRFGDGWDVRLKEYQRWLYDAVKSRSELGAVPIVGPSIWGRLGDDYRLLGDISNSMDIANLHYYTGGRRPSIAGVPTRIEEIGGKEEYGIESAIADAQSVAPGKPLWITEFGYGMDGPGVGLSRAFITPTSSAKYILRGLAESFARGIPRTFVYSFVDDEHRDPPRYHGLVTAELERRPAYEALRNLLSVLSDPGDPWSPANLSWLQTSSAIKQLPLLQKRDGRFFLIFWQDVDSYDGRARSDLVVAPSQVTLEFEEAFGTARIFAPNISSEPQKETSGAGTLVFDVVDQLTVVELSF